MADEPKKGIPPGQGVPGKTCTPNSGLATCIPGAQLARPCRRFRLFRQRETLMLGSPGAVQTMMVWAAQLQSSIAIPGCPTGGQSQAGGTHLQPCLRRDYSSGLSKHFPTRWRLLNPDQQYLKWGLLDFEHNLSALVEDKGTSHTLFATGNRTNPVLSPSPLTM